MCVTAAQGSISVVSVRGRSPPCPDGVLTTGQMAIPLLPPRPARTTLQTTTTPPPSPPPLYPLLWWGRNKLEHLDAFLSKCPSRYRAHQPPPPPPISTCSPDWAGAQSEAQALLWPGSDPQAPLAWAAAARCNAVPGLAKLELIRMCGAQEWPPPASL